MINYISIITVNNYNFISVNTTLQLMIENIYIDKILESISSVSMKSIAFSKQTAGQ